MRAMLKFGLIAGYNVAAAQPRPQGLLAFQNGGG